jgi:hypothetical protein
MSILLFILIGYGISNIIVYGSIFKGFRSFWDRVNPSFFGSLFGCMMCTPFWVGFFLSLIFQITGYITMSPLNYVGVDNIYMSVFLDACLCSGTTWLIHTFQEMGERAFNNE